MPVFPSSVVGTIQFEPEIAEASGSTPGDDSTFELTLSSFARTAMLSSFGPPWFIAHARFSRLRAAEEGCVAIEANLAQLRRDLDAEYAELLQQPHCSS